VSAYDAFAPIYDEWAAHMTEDVPFYVSLAREADGPVVELAVGNGRVAVPVARETGRAVIGVDSSAGMLAAARERAAAAGVELDLRAGDMRGLELDEPAALVYCPFRTRSEWEGLIEAAALEVEALYGWFDRRPFDDRSPEFVWIARRPA
jgi:ubiquinone/menaquinone biosynthesis C-methylase UbiE